MLQMHFSTRLDWDDYIVSITKKCSKENQTLICSMAHLYSEVAPHLYKSTTQPWIEYYFHILTDTLNCYLEVTDNRYVGLLLLNLLLLMKG